MRVRTRVRSRSLLRWTPGKSGRLNDDQRKIVAQAETDMEGLQRLSGRIRRPPNWRSSTRVAVRRSERSRRAVAAAALAISPNARCNRKPKTRKIRMPRPRPGGVGVGFRAFLRNGDPDLFARLRRAWFRIRTWRSLSRSPSPRPRGTPPLPTPTSTTPTGTTRPKSTPPLRGGVAARQRRRAERSGSESVSCSFLSRQKLHAPAQRGPSRRVSGGASGAQRERDVPIVSCDSARPA